MENQRMAWPKSHYDDLKKFGRQFEGPERGTLRYKTRIFFQYRLPRKLRVLYPSVNYRKIKWFIQRGRRGYSDWDLSEGMSYTLDFMIANVRYMAKHAHSYPTDYMNGDEEDFPFNMDSKNKGRGFDGYIDDLNTIENGLEHRRAAALNLDETCSCCDKYCADLECPIVKEAWDLYTELFTSLWI